MLWTCIEHTNTLQQGYIHPFNNPIYMEGGREKEEEDQAMRSSNSRIKGGGLSYGKHQQDQRRRNNL